MVGLLDLALIPTLIGNLVIIGSSIKEVSMIGYYIYFAGMDLVMFALLNFTREYCKGIGNKLHLPVTLSVMLAADAAQMMLNLFFHHAFELEAVEVQGLDYYRLVPYLGQTIHRIVNYTVFLCVILIFLMATVRTAKVFRERYSVILLALVLIGVWETFYIFSRTPIDRSMIGFGVFGILVFYLSIYYRPLRLLDRMLSNIAADMPEGLYVYDATGKCIWANKTGMELIHLKEGELDEVSAGLVNKFGKRPYKKTNWSDTKMIGNGDKTAYYSLENYAVNEDSKHLAGSYLIIRDNTEEQHKINQEIYNSTHDSLTGLLTKQHLYECIRNVLSEDKQTDYVVLFIDVRNFKIVNDIFSTAFGDNALLQIAGWINRRMNVTNLNGRLMGDTFGVLMPASQFEADRDVIEQELTNFVVSDGNLSHRLLIQIGVYEVTDRGTNVSVMFDRAHLALSTISGNYKKHIAYYDKQLREKVLWEQQITADLSEAIRTRQIRPYLQPITDRSGKIVGAEALAR